MKENKYDDEVFFEKYSQMDRSREGLEGAGEWETLKTLLPDLKGKRMLDIGCGYGWHCIYAMEQGAESAVGIDISEKMLAIAKEKTSYDKVSYSCVAMEDARFEPDSFDIVFSSLAFHYLESYEDMIRRIHEWLRPDGQLIFNVEHPVFTAYGSQDWYYDEAGEILHFPVDRYFMEGKRYAQFLGEEVVKYHRTLTTYVNSLLKNGFQILNITEPTPTEEMIKDIPGMADELRRPMMLIILAKKI